MGRYAEGNPRSAGQAVKIGQGKVWISTYCNLIRQFRHELIVQEDDMHDTIKLIFPRFMLTTECIRCRLQVFKALWSNMLFVTLMSRLESRVLDTVQDECLTGELFPLPLRSLTD